LTKHEPIESGLKCPLSIEEASTGSINVNDIVAENVAKLHISRLYLEEAPKLKTIRVKKERATKRSNLGRATRKLYNMELDAEPEKPLHIELDLYQMETY
jgi:hypothetical protein